MSVYAVTLRTLSPVHIGDGNVLRQGFEFAVRANQTYFLNVDAILEDKAEGLLADRSGHYPPPGSLLTDQDYASPRYFRYVLRGAPRSGKTFAEVRAFIKDVYDRPYIPGSSLKGALRTALAWTGWKEVKTRLLERGDIGRSKSWAGRPLEGQLFGKDPNHDLLRLLQVSDLHGPTEAGGGLVLANAQVLTKRSLGSPVELEVLSGDQVLHGTIKIDETLFAPWADKSLKFANRRHWLEELMLRAQAHSQARIQKLVDWYEKAEGATRVAQFYRQLTGIRLPANQALVQIGWGAGWDGKTFWTHLQANQNLFEQLVHDFRLHRAGKNAPPRRPGADFPSSRRVAVSVRQNVAQIVAPFGWVLLEMKEKP
jgi:CRISPR-associated protein Csm5